MKKIALGKVRDFLINLCVFKEKASRLSHLHNFFGLNDENVFTTDEINVYTECLKELRSSSKNTTEWETRDNLEKWNCRIAHVLQFVKKY